jgi:hypothetical protein
MPRNRRIKGPESDPPNQDFGFGAQTIDLGVIDDLRAEHTVHGKLLAKHEGQLTGTGELIAAIQSSFGSWIAAVASAGALVFAGFALITTLLILNMQQTGNLDEKIDGASRRFDERLNAVAAKVDALPATLQRELINIAAMLANVRGQPPIVIQPGERSEPPSPRP